MADPKVRAWVCERCGSPASGDMCRACGKSYGYGPVESYDRLAIYDARPMVNNVGERKAKRPTSPHVWAAIALGITLLFIILGTRAG